MLLNALPLLAPIILLGAAFAPRWLHGLSAQKGAMLAEGAALAAVAVAGLSAFLLATSGSGDSFLFGLSGIGFSVRLDIISVVMLLLVTFIGWVVVRYARTYLDGEVGQTRFSVWLLATLAAVLLLVQSGNLVQFVVSWIATSLCLHRLLLFYPGRIGAQRAARKKFLTARAGDAVNVAIRPESIAVEAGAAPGASSSTPGEGTALDAVVLQSAYLGVSVSHQLRTTAGVTLAVVVPRSHERPRLGDAVRVRWRAADAMVLPRSTTGARKEETR